MHYRSGFASFDFFEKSSHEDYESDFGITTVLQPVDKTKLKKPRMFQVLLHNDDFTPRGFVVHVLQNVFKKSENLAVDIMMKAHKSGMARVAVYSFGIAETKAHQANQLAEREELPLRFSIEPIDDGDSD